MGNRIDNSWLRARRERLGLSQEQLIERLNHNLGRIISRVSISHWERNQRHIMLFHSVEDTTALAKSLEWSVAELFGAMGHDVSPVHVGELELPADVYQLCTLVMNASAEKRAIILKLIRVFYDEIPDPPTETYQIPENAHLHGKDNNES